MGAEFRVIDTGLRGGRANIAFDQALIEARAGGHIPDTIRFLRFTPSALVGRHQILTHELDLPACLARGIEVGRRITGGGAIHLDPGQLGWELIFQRSSLGIDSLEMATARICTAAAAGLSRLGVEARFRPRNDIEVAGRKLSGTGGFFDGDLLFYQGTVLIDFDAEAMLAALRLPAAKLARHGIGSIGARLVSLRELLGAAPPPDAVQQALLDGFCAQLGIAVRREPVSPIEENLAAGALADEIGTDEFVNEPHSAAHHPGWSSAELALPGGQIFITEGLLNDLQNEAQLAGVLGHEIGHVINRHAAQQMAKGQLGQFLGAAFGVGASGGDDGGRRAQIAAAMVNQMTQLRYSRTDESEADHYGLKYMAEAGYDPRAMLEVMKILKQASGGQSPPEFLATHPLPETRLEQIRDEIRKDYPDGIPSRLTLGRPLE